MVRKSSCHIVLLLFVVSLMTSLVGCKSGDDLGSYNPNLCNETLTLNSKVQFEKPEAFSWKKVSDADRIFVEVDYQCLIDIADVENHILKQWLHLSDESMTLLMRRNEIGAHSFPVQGKDFAQVDSVLRSECVASYSKENRFHLSFTLPDDPGHGQQLHFSNTHLTDYWGQFWESDIIPSLSTKVVVAVIDSGVDVNHEDLVDNLWVNVLETPGNGVDDDNNGYVDDIHGYNVVSEIGDPSDEEAFDFSGGTGFHGTAVSGIIGAVGGNSKGVSGVMPNQVSIMALNAMGPLGYFTETALVKAIQYAVNNGADVINLSLGSRTSSPVIENAISQAVSQGVFVVAAAGNEGTDLVNYPAKKASLLDGFVSVAATVSSTSRMASYSSFDSRYVEIAAPGSDYPFGTSGGSGLMTTLTGNNYGRMDGTSSASPVISGAAALLIARSRSLGKFMTPAEVEQSLKAVTSVNTALRNKVQQCRSLDFSML